MPHEISKYVYAILGQGKIIIATLDAEEDQNQMDRRPSVTQLVTGHKYPAAMVFPATPANYDALQTLYEDIKVPPIPMEPNNIVREILAHQKYVMVRVSTKSYEHARRNPRLTIHSGGIMVGKNTFMVPYDENDNEITEV